MTTRRQAATSPVRPLEALGITELEERAYRWLLTHPQASAQDIARALLLSVRTTRTLLETVEDKGLITHSPERPHRYMPASPDVAIQARVLHLQESLQRAQGAIQDLQQLAAAGRIGEQEQIIELISNRDAGKLVYEQVQRSAQQEISILARLPILYSAPSQPNDPDGQIQRDVQARGVRYRSVNGADLLSVPGVLDRIREDVMAGEEARLLPSVPFKMTLVDRRIALIVLKPNQSDSPSLLVRYSALLDGLYALFEILWERAAPIHFTRNGNLATRVPAEGSVQDIDDLIPLMTAGFHDKAIAHHLGQSMRTVNRRIFDLMKHLGARTRFQAGWLAASQLRSTGIHSKERRSP